MAGCYSPQCMEKLIRTGLPILLPHFGGGGKLIITNHPYDPIKTKTIKRVMVDRAKTSHREILSTDCQELIEPKPCSPQLGGGDLIKIGQNYKQGSKELKIEITRARMPRYAVFIHESGTVQNSLEFEYCNLSYVSLNPIDITDCEAFLFS